MKIVYYVITTTKKSYSCNDQIEVMVGPYSEVLRQGEGFFSARVYFVFTN